MKDWRGRYPGGKAAHDEFGAILSDIRHFGITTTNDRKRLRALARTFGWSEYSIEWLERVQHRTATTTTPTSLMPMKSTGALQTELLI